MDLRRVAPTGEWCVFHREGAGGGDPTPVAKDRWRYSLAAIDHVKKKTEVGTGSIHRVWEWIVGQRSNIHPGPETYEPGDRHGTWKTSFLQHRWLQGSGKNTTPTDHKATC